MLYTIVNEIGRLMDIVTLLVIFNMDIWNLKFNPISPPKLSDVPKFISGIKFISMIKCDAFVFVI